MCCLENRFFDAYLIINGIANSLINPKKADFEVTKENGNIEHLIISNFIHQRDFTSNLDFRNQITRGISFFKYLEEHPKYSNVITDYYKLKKTAGYLGFFKTILLFLMKTHFTDEPDKRKQIVLIDKKRYRIWGKYRHYRFIVYQQFYLG